MEALGATKCLPFLLTSRNNGSLLHNLRLVYKLPGSINHCIPLSLRSDHGRQLFLFVLMLNLVIEVDGGLSEVDAPKHHDVVFYELYLLVLPLDVVQAALGVSC